MDMRRRQGRRTLFGALIILGLILAAASIFLLDHVLRGLTSSYTIVGVFADPVSIQTGSPVWLAGQAVGEVERIETAPPADGARARVAATLRVPTRYRSFIRRDSELEIASARLLGEPVVNIMPGNVASPVLPPGDTLVARRHTTTETILATADTTRRAFDSLAAATRLLAADARRRTPAAAALIASLRAADHRLEALTAVVDRGPLADLLADTSTLAIISRARAAVDEITTLAAERTAERGDSALAGALERLARRTERTLKTLDELQALIDEPRGFPGRWKRDPALRNAITGVRTQLDSLIVEIRRRPWRFVF